MPSRSESVQTTPGNPDIAPRVGRSSGEAVYRFEHETRYMYASVVATSQHVAWLEPRPVPYQRNASYELIIDPAPLRILRRVDYFGNVVHQFELLRPHQELSVISRGVVAVRDRTEGFTAANNVGWEQVVGALRRADDIETRQAVPFVSESPGIVSTPDIARFARDCFEGGQPLIDAAIRLTRRIHDEFTFDPTATTPATPVSKVLAERRGVCQDFAHFQIACLRSLGLAARYVSGYLLTDPPPGQARLIGADASHAWVSVYCPGLGWIDLDPTNAVVASRRHVTIAWGRDYGDVTPLRGVLLGGSEHALHVGVSVMPVEDAAPFAGS